MGRKVVTALRAIGILLLIWVLLLGIGFVSGEIPPLIPGKPSHAATADAGADADAGTDTESVSDAGADAADPDAGAASESSDAGSGPAAAGDSPGAGVLWRAAVCARAADQSALETAALALGQLVGDASPELVVACGSEVHVVGFDESRPLRVAHFGRSGSARAARPILVDVDGDGRHDLVVGYTQVDEAGSPLGGSLSVVLSTEEGGLKEPRAVAPIAVSGLAAGDLDGRPGAEIGAVNWADGHGLRPSELWLFAGGVSIARRHRIRLGNDGHGLELADLDADGELEWVVGDATGLHAFGADGSAGVVVEHPRVSAVHASDLDGDGNDEVLALAETLLRAMPAAAPITSTLVAPTGARRVSSADVDRDGDLDIVVVTREHVVVLRQDAGRFEQEAWITLPGTLRPHDVVVTPDQVVIVASSVRGWELVAVSPERTEIPAAEAPMLRDAPLVLSL